MKYSKPEDVVTALIEGRVKEGSIKQSVYRLKTKEEFEKASILEKGLSMWKERDTAAKCTYYDKLVDELSLPEILELYDKDSRLLTTSHCLRFTILMMEDSDMKIKDYKGMVIHPRDIFLEE